jgi:cold shock CspA family protein
MPYGTIKNVVRDRGFGFIRPDEAPDRGGVFFHQNNVKGIAFEQLRVNDRVTYELGQDEWRRGTKAIRVQPLHAA